ncbi:MULTISPECIES: transglycosylase SLT domain-containing protein [Methylomonas]|uniref:Lytic transglycosylase n=2 Tax=Methylomonas TaxID=416 RepID=A0A140E607_9GAMM|nr:MULTISPECIES: transglycosylase SLT domain-containing protein [Methylomonas]AMK78831.1 lytic transglycosylase [Methylomonas denitrificans]OAH97022.1 lytic transglycosylase [Methylomonas methanica]
MHVIPCFLLLAALTGILPNSARADEISLVTQRQQFLRAEQALNQNRDAEYFALASGLKDYPLYPYLQYQWLKNHLDADGDIKQFLADYAASRYAAGLRQRWLLALGKKRQWPLLLNNYQGSDDPELQCYVGLAQFETGQTLEAFNQARALWLSGKSQPDNCDALFEVYKSSPYFNKELINQRFHAALNRDNQSLASYMTRFLSGPELNLANIWLKLHRQPETVTADTGWRENPEQAGELFAHAIDRWLETDVGAAMTTWDNVKAQITIAPATTAVIEKRIAVALALKHDKRAYARLSLLENSDESAREWRVRAALNTQNWQDVTTAIAGLNDEEKSREKWQYWQARGLAESGQSAAANALFQQLAKNRSFYGFLAAGRLRQAIELVDRPLTVSSQDLDFLQNQPDFQVFFELLAIDRKPEAKRQWWYAIAKLDSRQLPVAAKLAQQANCPALAIATIAKANHWDDVNLRFPLAYVQQIQSNAAAQQLDPALLLGLIRQESAFDELADSPAGAKGLMQVMPNTGRQIAADLRDNWDSDYNLFKPELNVKYGAFYFKKLLRQFNGHVALAAAAYNAGANKVKRWLPENRTLPADIWIETIPYKETRGYVASVLMYSLIYQQRLQRGSLKIDDLLREVMPG